MSEIELLHPMVVRSNQGDEMATRTDGNILAFVHIIPCNVKFLPSSIMKTALVISKLYAFK